jgi:hypothetical protein
LRSSGYMGLLITPLLKSSCRKSLLGWQCRTFRSSWVGISTCCGRQQIKTTTDLTGQGLMPSMTTSPPGVYGRSLVRGLASLGRTSGLTQLGVCWIGCSLHRILALISLAAPLWPKPAWAQITPR